MKLRTILITFLVLLLIGFSFLCGKIYGKYSQKYSEYGKAKILLDYATEKLGKK